MLRARRQVNKARPPLARQQFRWGPQFQAPDDGLQQLLDSKIKSRKIDKRRFQIASA